MTKQDVISHLKRMGADHIATAKGINEVVSVSDHLLTTVIPNGNDWEWIHTACRNRFYAYSGFCKIANEIEQAGAFMAR